MLVGYELAAKPGVDFRRVDKHSGLEIVFEAAEIYVCRAYGAETVIDHHGFAVEHPRFIEIYLYAGTQAFHHVASRGIRKHARIAVGRNHHPYVHARQCCGLERAQYAFSGQEIRRLDIDALACVAYGLDHHEFHVAPFACGAAAEHLHGAFPAWGGVYFFGHERVSHERPVYRE